MTETKHPPSRLDKEREARRRLEEARLAFERAFGSWCVAGLHSPENMRVTAAAFREVEKAKADLRAAEAL